MGSNPGRVVDRGVLLRALSTCETLGEGKVAHLVALAMGGFDSDLVLGTSLVRMYGRCGSVLSARSAFARLPTHDVVACSAMISAYVENGFCDHAMRLFETMPYRNVVSWTALISGLARSGREDDSLCLFRRMDDEGVKPNALTLASALDACSGVAALAHGKLIHSRISQSGFRPDITLDNALLNMYGRCGNVANARSIFEQMHTRDVVTWTSMIGAYAVNRQGAMAVEMFRRMNEDDNNENKGGVKANQITFLNVLDACSILGSLTLGKVFHASSVAAGFSDSAVALGNALVNMYGKCGRPEEARRLFDGMRRRDVVSWTAMITSLAQNGHLLPARSFFDAMPCRNAVAWSVLIAAYAKHGQCRESLKLFQWMKQDGVKPNKVTLIGVLDACAGLAALKQGKLIHAIVAHGGFGSGSDPESDCAVGTALVKMYGKCGSPNTARRVFNRIHQRDVIAWTTMITALSNNGRSKRALELFHRMQQDGVTPSKITFISVLSACGYAGLLNEGWHHFASMYTDYGIVPISEHCVCMIDLVGRMGQLDEAERLICNLPFEPPFDLHVVAWKCFLSACTIFVEEEQGALAAEYLFELERSNATNGYRAEALDYNVIEGQPHEWGSLRMQLDAPLPRRGYIAAAEEAGKEV